MLATLNRALDRLLPRIGAPLELCCPGRVRNEAVERVRHEGVHWGRLR